MGKKRKLTNFDYKRSFMYHPPRSTDDLKSSPPWYFWIELVVLVGILYKLYLKFMEEVIWNIQ